MGSIARFDRGAGGTLGRNSGGRRRGCPGASKEIRTSTIPGVSGKSPIFVFCQHRTGSTLLRNMLNLHSRVAMTVDEMVVLNPWQRTLFDVLAKYDLTTDSGLRSGLEALYACEAYGAFWRYFDREKMPLEAIFDQVRTTEATAWGVVDAFLEFTRRTQGKERAGAKNF